LENIGREEATPCRLLTVGASEALLARLRSLGVPCAAATVTAGSEALKYARAWRYSHVLEVAPGTAGASAPATLLRVVDQQRKSVLPEPEALASQLSQSHVGSA
jgi:hypothetical protein